MEPTYPESVLYQLNPDDLEKMLKRAWQLGSLDMARRNRRVYNEEWWPRMLEDIAMVKRESGLPV